jgi:hypothetical protein
MRHSHCVHAPVTHEHCLKPITLKQDFGAAAAPTGLYSLTLTKSADCREGAERLSWPFGNDPSRKIECAFARGQSVPASHLW